MEPDVHLTDEEIQMVELMVGVGHLATDAGILPGTFTVSDCQTAAIVVASWKNSDPDRYEAVVSGRLGLVVDGDQVSTLEITRDTIALMHHKLREESAQALN